MSNSYVFSFSGLAQLTHHPDHATKQVGEVYTGGPFDISILELKAEDALDLTLYTPACLAKTSDRDSFDNQLATVAGWGYTEEWTLQSPPPKPLPVPWEPQEVEVMVLPVSDCPGFQPDGKTEVSPSEICAEERDSCQVSLQLS